MQNSIDAGSPTVEVWSEYIPGEGHEGTIALHVDDFGEGMDEKIIDDQFTRLFASTEEEDLTKIGKFGIGFVSVFALKPKAILVQTGRGGQYWEVLFHEDRSFSKSKLDVPVEGTQLTLFLEGTPSVSSIRSIETPPGGCGEDDVWSLMRSRLVDARSPGEQQQAAPAAPYAVLCTVFRASGGADDGYGCSSASGPSSRPPACEPAY